MDFKMDFKILLRIPVLYCIVVDLQQQPVEKAFQYLGLGLLSLKTFSCIMVTRNRPKAPKNDSFRSFELLRAYPQIVRTGLACIFSAKLRCFSLPGGKPACGKAPRLAKNLTAQSAHVLFTDRL